MKYTMLKGKIHRAVVKQADLNYVGSITVDTKVAVGDHVILMCYAQMTPEEAKENHPKVVFVDDENKIARVTNYEKHGKLTEDFI